MSKAAISTMIISTLKLAPTNFILPSIPITCNNMGSTTNSITPVRNMTYLYFSRTEIGYNLNILTYQICIEE